LVTTRQGAKAHNFDPASIDLRELDITDRDRLADLVRSYRPQAVVHLAGVTGSSDPTGGLCRDVNLTATSSLFDSLDAAGVESVVTLGSAAEYGSQPIPFREDMPTMPVSPYAVSKAMATKFALEMHVTNGFPVTVLRVFTAYGDGQPSNMFLSQLIDHALSDRHFEMSDGVQLRDFVYAADVAEAVLSALYTKTAVGKVVNIGSGKGIPLRDVARIVWRLCDANMDRLAIGALSKTADDSFDTEADISRAKELLNWIPLTPFLDQAGGGLSEMISKTMR
jgi:nucleoside-diphosphate-sugar epimerase